MAELLVGLALADRLLARCKSTQLPSGQAVRFTGQTVTHVPLAHAGFVAGQTLPQVPQFWASLWVFSQDFSSAHQVSGIGQAQWPCWQ